MRYGYCRVSSREQNPDRQYEAMIKNDITDKHIYLDRISGKDFIRPQYNKMLGELKKGDLVLQILAYVAETERNFIRQRQAEGIAIAKRNGVHFGPKGREKPDEFEKCQT